MEKATKCWNTIDLELLSLSLLGVWVCQLVFRCRMIAYVRRRGWESKKAFPPPF